jgi:stage II sporulation protein D
MRFGINGSMPAGNKNSGVYVNDDDTKLKTLEGVTVLSGKGELTTLTGESFTVITADGTNTVKNGSGNSGSASNKNNKKGIFVIEGMGSGHNLGMSQYGAKAMAEAGYDYDEILEFYFTDITIETQILIIVVKVKTINVYSLGVS